MHFNLPNIRVKVLTLTYCHDTLATILLPWRFGNLTLPNQLLRPVLSTTQQDEFRTGLKSCETACLRTQNVSPNPYPHTWLGDQNRWAKHVWYPGSLATCHNHNQLLRPVLGRLQSDEFRNGLKTFVNLFFPTQNQGQSAYVKSKMFGPAIFSDFGHLTMGGGKDFNLHFG